MVGPSTLGRKQRPALWALLILHDRRLTFEFTRLRKRAKPAVAGRVQRRVRRRHLEPGSSTSTDTFVPDANLILPFVPSKVDASASTGPTSPFASVRSIQK